MDCASTLFDRLVEIRVQFNWLLHAQGVQNYKKPGHYICEQEIRLLSPSCAPTLVSGALRKPPAAYYKCMAGGPPVAGIQEDRVRAMVVLGDA